MIRLKAIDKKRILEKFRSVKLGVFLYAVLLAVVLFITSYGLKLLLTEIMVRDIIASGIDYEAVRDLRLTDEVLDQTDQKVTKVLKKYPELKESSYIDSIGYLTLSMMANGYDLLENKILDRKTFIRGIRVLHQDSNFQELYHYYQAILSDLMYFPVPKIEKDEVYVFYDNSWYGLRTYGGNRRHEGTDLMASNNQRGYFPIISMTDGYVEKLGWLEQGGYRIGIRSPSGGYFYYAHLSSYAPGIEEGDPVIAGQLLGFMGDSGYGSEGTVGQFDVHLHLGIYVDTEFGEMSFNPYWILRILEEKKIEYQYSDVNTNS